MILRICLLSTLWMGLSACAGLGARTTTTETETFALDRAAILAMQGDFEVDFHFRETVALAAGYQRHQDKDSGAFETVRLVSDSGRRIVLQHLLVVGNGQVVKHWRQDWEYEAPRRWEFSEAQTWTLRELPRQTTRGAWTQCVYGVADAPRYCGTGRWNHRYGTPTWTSDRSWRPLPRREYTQREDYDALNVENRHSITPGGWTHEQDNTKVRRDHAAGAGSLVREFGFNDYRRIEGHDFSAASEYWHRTGDYWAQVRQAWDERILAQGGIRLHTSVDGMALIGPLFAQAQRVFEGEAVSPEDIAVLLDRHTGAPDSEAPAVGRAPALTVSR